MTICAPAPHAACALHVRTGAMATWLCVVCAQGLLLWQHTMQRTAAVQSSCNRAKYWRARSVNAQGRLLLCCPARVAKETSLLNALKSFWSPVRLSAVGRSSYGRGQQWLAWEVHASKSCGRGGCRLLVVTNKRD